SRAVRRKLLARVADVPFAYAVAAPALGQIHVHVVLVVTVGTRAEHGGEARAGQLPQVLAEPFVDLRVGQPHDRAVGEFYRAHVERVGLAVLREPGADDPVAPAAII